ncbi:hypothetical protein C8J56DRAFT_791301 [Mycena floridula]|nr:hypothetical protein C8J56DRAFT_791301 [Mycena floridula]
MAPTKTAKAAASKEPKKEKVHHPSSRKADQLTRKAHRKGKLGNLASNRTKKHHHLGKLLSFSDFHAFFFHALPSEGVLTLEELHALVRDKWLTRHDQDLEKERAARRKGRPKSVKELKFEEIKLREAEEYRTGFELIDLTHEPTVALFRKWDLKEVAYMQLLRFIRISSLNPAVTVVSRLGTHFSVRPAGGDGDVEMSDDEEPVPTLLAEPPTRFSSTMMTMDSPLT